MTRCILVIACLLLAACKKETAAPASAPQTTAAQTTTTAAQDVRTAQVDTILPVAPVPVARCEATDKALTMYLNEAPEKLHVSVRIHHGEEEIAFVRQPAEGQKVAVLNLPKLERGKYVLEGLWGGNRACVAEIEVK